MTNTPRRGGPQARPVKPRKPTAILVEGSNLRPDLDPRLFVEYADTADMDDGQPLPPFIDDGVVWRVVRRMAGRTLWRRILLAGTGAHAVPQLCSPHCGAIRFHNDCSCRRSHAVARDRAATLVTAILQIIATAPEDERRRQLENYFHHELADAARSATADLPPDDEFKLFPRKGPTQ
jgi:hypothetical protein